MNKKKKKKGNSIQKNTGPEPKVLQVDCIFQIYFICFGSGPKC